MTTKNKLAEQIQRIYSRFKGERENTKPIYDIRELYEIINQAINRRVVVETKQGFKEGDISVPPSSIIEYTLTPNQDAGQTSQSYIDLAVYPVRLPLDMGVWKIFREGERFDVFIPLPTQIVDLMQGTIISALEQKTGYFLEQGKRIRFTKDESGGNVIVQVLVSDLSALAASDPLPISADHEIMIIQDVLQTLGMGQIALAELQSQINNANTD